MNRLLVCAEILRIILSHIYLSSGKVSSKSEMGHVQPYSNWHGMTHIILMKYSLIYCFYLLFFWQILLRLCLTVSSMILPTYHKKWYWFYFLYWPSPALWNSSKTCSVHKTKHWDCLGSIFYRADIKLEKSLPACNLLLVNSIELSHIFFKKSISLTNSK